MKHHHMMLIEMMSYAGDNLSYYIDTQFKALFKQKKRNLLSLHNHLDTNHL